MFALSRVHFGQIETGTKWALIAGSVALSVVSYSLVERPARNRSRLSNRTFATTLIVVATIVVGAFAQAHVSSSRRIAGFSFDAESFDIAAEKHKRLALARATCRQTAARNCPPANDGKPKILFVGDSTVIDLLNMLAPLFPDHQAVLDELGGCPPTPVIRDIARRRNPNIEKCEELSEFRFDPRSLEGVDVLVISATYDWYRPEHLRPYLDFVAAQGIRRVVVAGNYIRVREHFPFVAHELGLREDISIDMSELGEFANDAFAFEDELELLAAEYGATFLSMRDLACSGGECAVFVDGVPFSWDRVHFSLEFARYLSGRLDLSRLR
jgi:hypothetical protein